MPFSRELRQWYLRAWGQGDPAQARCQFRFYSEDKGFFLACAQRGSGLFVARWTLQEWGTVGIPFCHNHFAGLLGDTPFTTETSVYPELAQARVDYRANRHSFDQLPEFSSTHRTRLGDLGFDLYYFQSAQDVVWRYAVTHSDDKPPADTHRHRYPRWYDLLATF